MNTHKNQFSLTGASLKKRFPISSLMNIALALAWGAGVVTASEWPVSLAGSWRFDLDRADAGIQDRWFERALPQHIQLPGALQNQGFGDDITPATKWTGDVGADRWLKQPQYEKYRQPGNLKVPFFLQPEKHYVGAAWYQRDLEIPKDWQGNRVVLTLERPHWETRVWVDHRPVGTNDSLSTPHVYDLGTGLASGKHTLTIRVDNRMVVDVGSWSHSVSDHTQGNWNGLVGRIELSVTSPVWIEDIQVYPNVAKRNAKVVAKVGNHSGKAGTGNLYVSVANQTSPGSDRPAVPMPVFVKWDGNGGQAEFEVAPQSKQTWDEFTPQLYKVGVNFMDLSDSKQWLDTKSVTFGLREISTTPDQLFAINGRKTFLRGTLECAIFPKTGYPPTEVNEWRRIIRVCQAHGLNHIRFHSWCPPEAAFAAADELGFYLHVECAAWANVGSGGPQDQWLYRESERIVRAYGNHPSFIMLAYGNEPNGPKHKEWLGEWVNHWKARDSRRLYTSGAGWPVIPENQYHVTPAPRGPQGWLGRDYRARVEAERPRRDAPGSLEAPVIVHEMGQWCVYPNFDEIKKYTGPLRPKNFEIFRDSLAEHGMLGQWKDFLHASGRLQALCYKEEIEAAMRTPGVSGVQLLDLHDFPGQGTALVGVLDPFWEEKGYIKPEEFRRFYNTTVPLARLLKRVWTTGETLACDVELSHFGSAPLENSVASWKLSDAKGKVVASGEWPAKTFPVDRGLALGQVSVALANLPAPAAYKLVVGLRGTPFENDWSVWVVPAQPASAAPADVLLTSALDAEALRRLEAGGRVFLATAKLSPTHPRLTFEPIFWNRYMFNTQNRHTLGLLCDPQHPALAQFPTASWQDWLWNDIVTQARAVILDELPQGLCPIVQPIDDWNSNRKLGLVFECRVGQGRLLVCAADLAKDLDQRPAARQLRESLLAYAAGPKFSPKIEVSAGDLQRVLHGSARSTLVNLGAKIVKVDSEDREHGNVAANAIDGDPDTIWHTRWQPKNDPMPHELVIDLSREIMLKGITYLPRPDMANGRLGAVQVFCGNDPQSWSDATALAQWPNSDQLQTLLFAAPVKARYLRLLVTSEVGGQPFASMAELDILTDDKAQ